MDGLWEFIQTAGILLCIGATLSIMGGILWKILWDRVAPVKTVQAQVTGKYIAENTSIRRGSTRVPLHRVVFLIDGKERSFTVSSFSYGSYRKGQTGTLKYKGSRILDFS